MTAELGGPAAMNQCASCLSEIPEGSRPCPACGETSRIFDPDATEPLDTADSTESQSSPIPKKLSNRGEREIEPRFLAGMMILDRYRIITSLGKGGMGEVYRADDLRLRQRVALKFIPRALLGHTGLRDRLFEEVRIARQVSHRAVCRVYDIAEVEGQTFLTMEFIDGEDLGVLLKRIGRLPEDKGVEIARQLCEGLAAVHEKGIVHRDLKPRNIMLDGRGQVRLTDFGLAVFADDIAPTDFHSGTPAYMAPEQLAGKVPTEQSDLFALGLVLYEVFTGRRAYPAKHRNELVRLYKEYRPTAASDLVPGLDPRIDKIIRHCLEIDPSKRPKSTQVVANSLPKRDALATALAEGRIPSPELVANAGDEGTLSAKPAGGMLAAVVIGVLLVAYLSEWATLRGQFPLRNSPRTLSAKAQKFLHQFDDADLPADHRQGFYYDYNYLDHLIEKDSSILRWSSLESAEAPAVVFWYRQSPEPLVAETMSTRTYPGRVTPLDPPPIVPGMVSLFLDPDGRLLEFARVPRIRRQKPSEPEQVNFEPIFKAADLDWSRAQPSEPKWAPPFFAEKSLAWRVPRSGRPGSPLEVEAATHQGQLVYFKVFHGPWDRPDALRGPLQPVPSLHQYLYAGLFCLLVGGSALLARHNARQGLGDLSGATRLAFVMFACHMICMFLCADHVPSFQAEATLLMRAVGFAAIWSGLCWLLYFAFEPYVRRRWPWRMISWNRLLAGRFLDPMVGRDLLIGALLGIFLTLMHQLGVILPPIFGRPSPLPLTTWPAAFTNVPFHLLVQVPSAVRASLQLFFILFLLVLFVREEWVAALMLLLLSLLMMVSQESEFHVFWVAAMGATAAATLFVALRYGLLSVIVGIFFCDYLYQTPLTLNLSVWYGWQSFIYILWPILLAVLGFLIARGGHSTLGELSSSLPSA